ncbi:MAG TPA: hypothetical protein VKN99_13570 [Polyangia bacterium]|nr:hypothetical protein [Polyangia bacterium]
MRSRPVLVLALALACAHEPAPRTWERATTLEVAASHRCQGARCTCRDPSAADDQSEKNPPPNGRKRYEFRIGPSIDFTWLEVEGHGVLFKETETGGAACVYVDLPAGQKAHVVFHVEAQQAVHGTALDLQVSEYGPQGWYDTARIDCGGGGSACERTAMADWLARIHALKRGEHDPCGSTKIERPNWTAPPTDLPYPPVITVELWLDVYKFVPRLPHGSPQCGQRHKDYE